LSDLYKLFSTDSGYQLTNRAGDRYTIYLTTYSLLNPVKPTEDGYIDVFMLGFNCKRANSHLRQRYDAKTKITIVAVFKVTWSNTLMKHLFMFVLTMTDLHVTVISSLGVGSLNLIAGMNDFNLTLSITMIIGIVRCLFERTALINSYILMPITLQFDKCCLSDR
jgi:hypothetical protein